MAGYNGANLALLVGGLTGEAMSLWSYKTTDTHATVDTAGYISDAKSRGLKVDDQIIVIKTDDSNHLSKWHSVISVNATTGAADLSDGTTVGGTGNTD